MKLLWPAVVFCDHQPLAMLASITAVFKKRRDLQYYQPAWDRTRLCDALVAWQDWKRVFGNTEETVPRDSLVEKAFQFRQDLGQYLHDKMDGLTPMQAYNMI